MNVDTVAQGWQFPDADQFMRTELARDGSYQGTHLSAALAHVTHWRCAVDVGAHVGTWSRILSRRFERVIAVEPSPDTYACLQANMVTFGCANVACRNVAVGANVGCVSMVLDKKEILRANTGARYVRPGGAIPCETIDQWVLPALDFLKLDIEGSEFAALSGALQTLARCRPVVLFEVKGFGAQRYGESKDASQALLASLGYRDLAHVGRDQIWGPA